MNARAHRRSRSDSSSAQESTGGGRRRSRQDRYGNAALQARMAVVDTPEETPEETPETGGTEVEQDPTLAPTREEIEAGEKLTFGQRGEMVRWLQRSLHQLGFPTDRTGRFSKDTLASLKRFQKIYRMPVSGKLGPRALRRLDRALVRSMRLSDFRAIIPQMPEDTARKYLPHLNQSMDEAGIKSNKRKAAYIAQLAHESDGFNTLEEYADGSAYEGREDLGNTQPGDGRRYKGRGPIQITGRYNYQKYGEILGVNLEKRPRLAGTARYGFRIAAAYWKENKLNRKADQGDFDGITQTINGGQNGREDRRAYWARAKKVLRRSQKDRERRRQEAQA